MEQLIRVMVAARSGYAEMAPSGGRNIIRVTYVNKVKVQETGNCMF